MKLKYKILEKILGVGLYRYLEQLLCKHNYENNWRITDKDVHFKFCLKCDKILIKERTNEIL